MKRRVTVLWVLWWWQHPPDSTRVGSPALPSTNSYKTSSPSVLRQQLLHRSATMHQRFSRRITVVQKHHRRTYNVKFEELQTSLLYSTFMSIRCQEPLLAPITLPSIRVRKCCRVLLVLTAFCWSRDTRYPLSRTEFITPFRPTETFLLHIQMATFAST